MKVREILNGVGENVRIVVLKDNTRHTDVVAFKGIIGDVTCDVLDLVVRYSYVKKDVLLGATLYVCCEKGVA